MLLGTKSLRLVAMGGGIAWVCSFFVGRVVGNVLLVGLSLLALLSAASISDTWLSA